MLRPRGMGIMDYIAKTGADLLTPPQASPVDRERSPLQRAMDRPQVQVSQPNASAMVTIMPNGTIATASPTPQIQQQFAMPKPSGMPTPPKVVPARPRIGDMGGAGVVTPGADVMGMEKLAEQAAKAEEIERKSPEIAAQPEFQNTVKEFFGDRENMLQLALAFNSMRMRPDTGLASVIGSELKDIRETTRVQKASTRTAEVLRESHPRLAALLEQGVIDPKTATTIAYKNPSQINQMIELLETNPEQFKQLAQAGAFGGDVDMGQGAFSDATAKSLIQRSDAIRNNAVQARTLMTELSRFEQILESNPSLETGPMQQRMQSLREFGASIGIPVDQVQLAAGQSLNAAAFNLVANELRKNKGPQTDFDAEFTARFVPSLGNTPEANEQILGYMNSANRIMTIHGSMLTGTSTNMDEAREQIVKIEDSQMNTPAAIKVNNTWLSFDEFYRNAKQQAAKEGVVVSDFEILDDWKEQAGKL